MKKINQALHKNILSGFAPPDAWKWFFIKEFKPNRISINQRSKSIFESDKRSPIKVAKFSPNGDFIAYGDEKGYIDINYVWYFNTSVDDFCYRAHTACVKDVIFYSEDKVISCSKDGTIAAFDLSRKEHKSMSISGKSLTKLDINRYKNQLVVGCEDKLIRIFDVNTWSETSTINAHKGGITSVKFSCFSDLLASGDSKGFIKIWNVRSGQEIFSKRIHRKEVVSISFLNRDKQIVSAGKDGSVCITSIFPAVPSSISLTTPLKEGDEISHNLKGHAKAISSLTISSDELIAITGSDDGTGHVWDLRNKKFIANLNCHINDPIQSVISHPNNRFYTLVQGNSIANYWNARTVKERRNRICDYETLKKLKQIRDIFLWLVFPIILLLISRNIALVLFISLINLAVFYFLLVPLFKNLGKYYYSIDVFPDSSKLIRQGKKLFQIYLKTEMFAVPEKIKPFLEVENPKVPSLYTSLELLEMNKQRSSKLNHLDGYDLSGVKKVGGAMLDLGTEVGVEMAKEAAVGKIMRFLGFRKIGDYTRGSGKPVKGHWRRMPRK